jgi:HK97 family phage major capsid protein
MLKNAPTNRDDFDSPVRDNEFQYVQSSDSPNEIDAETLIDLVYAVNSAYRANGTFVMNSKTTAVVRKLKDPSTGLFLWAPSLSSSEPDRLLGYPVRCWEQLDDVATGSAKFPVMFGDFRRAYLLADRVGMRVTLDQSITSPGYHKFYVRRRVGGISWNVDSVKMLRTTG